VSGAFASGERDLEELTPGQRAALDRVVHPSLKGAGAPTAPAHIHPLRYKVILTDAGGRKEFDVSEEAMPDELADIPQIEL
jgi:hypothetical protein